MSEQFPGENEQSMALPRTPAELMQAAIARDDVRETALQNVYYIDRIYTEAAQSNGHKIYTEIHKVGEHYVITPSVESNDVHWAQVGGYHSMFDTARPDRPYSPARAQERALGEALGLSHKTVAAKGELSLDTTGAYALEIGDLRTRAHVDPDWVDDFSRQLADYPGLKAVYKPLYKNVEQPLGEELPLEIDAEVYPKLVRLPYEQTGVVAGIVTGVEQVDVPAVESTHHGDLRRKATLLLAATEGKTDSHQSVYNATGMRRPGTFKIRMGSLEQELSIHYVLDTSQNYSNVLVIYNNAKESTEFDDLRAMVTAAMHNLVAGKMPESARNVYNERFEHAQLDDRHRT